MNRLLLPFLALPLAALPACTDTENPTAPTETTAAPVLAAIANSWARRAPLPAGRSAAAAVGLNNLVFLVGGIAADEARTQKPNLYSYNTTTNTWTQRKSMPVAGAFMNGVSAINGKLYVGGVGSTRLYVYTPGTDTWVRKADLPSPAFDGAQGVIGGQLYVYTPVRGAGNFWRYDPSANTWMSLPVPRTVHDFPLAGVIGGKFYLAGGADAESASQADVEAYDPVTRTWTTKAPLPWTTSGVTGGTINGKLYAVASGITKAAVYNPATNTWTSIAPVPTAREAAVGAVAGGKLYVIGGATDASNATRIVEAYTP